MDYLFAILAGYALGSTPFSYLLSRLRGVNPHTVGTGNPGAANLFRQVSRPLGVLAAVLDGAKGALAVLVGGWLGLPEWGTLLPGAAAVAGHWHPLPLRFHGGAGLATAIGVCIGALPIAAAIGLAVGVAATAGWRNVGRGAVLGWTGLLGVALGLGDRWYVVLGLVGLGAIILGRARLTSRGTGDSERTS